VHSFIDGKALFFHPRITEFVKLMENTEAASEEIKTEPDAEPGTGTITVPKDFEKESKAYGSVLQNPMDIFTVSVCSFCSESFDHTTKLLYHMLHLHKANPVHFIIKHMRAKTVRCDHCSKPCMSPVTYALHSDQHTMKDKRPMECETCNRKYLTPIRFYTEDLCGDNAIPRNVKEFVNETIEKLKTLESGADIIGEKFSEGLTKHAKRPTINDIPRKYKKRKSLKKKKKHHTIPYDYGYEDEFIPRTVEDWVLNIPECLDIRVAISVCDRLEADLKMDEMLVESDEDEDGTSKPTSPGDQGEFADCNLATSYACTHCGEEFGTAWTLNVHHRNKHSEKINKCDVCKKNFITITDLEQHKLIHKIRPKTDVRPKNEVRSKTGNKSGDENWSGNESASENEEESENDSGDAESESDNELIDDSWIVDGSDAESETESENDNENVRISNNESEEEVGSEDGSQSEDNSRKNRRNSNRVLGKRRTGTSKRRMKSESENENISNEDSEEDISKRRTVRSKRRKSESENERISNYESESEDEEESEVESQSEHDSDIDNENVSKNKRKDINEIRRMKMRELMIERREKGKRKVKETREKISERRPSRSEKRKQEEAEAERRSSRSKTTTKRLIEEDDEEINEIKRMQIRELMMERKESGKRKREVEINGMRKRIRIKEMPLRENKTDVNEGDDSKEEQEDGQISKPHSNDELEDAEVHINNEVEDGEVIIQGSNWTKGQVLSTTEVSGDVHTVAKPGPWAGCRGSDKRRPKLNFENYRMPGDILKYNRQKIDYYYCPDCDDCDYDCQHEDHSVKIRVGDAEEHRTLMGHNRCKSTLEIRPQTGCKVSVASMAYSPLYGNKVRKLWKILAKNDMLTSESYEFADAQQCKVKDCDFKADTAMEIFKHIREQHIRMVKKLKIKIGGLEPNDDEEKEKKRPGPWSKTQPKMKKKATTDSSVEAESSADAAAAMDTSVERDDKNSLALDNPETPIPMDIT